VVSTRNVAREDLVRGRLGFRDVIRQRGDVKDFEGSITPDTLAVGRAVVDFVSKPAPTALPDLRRYIDRDRKVVRSETGQLVWNYGDEGFFTINTPGTQAVVGFACDREHVLADVSISIETPFALVYVCSTDKRKPIASANSLLVLAVARTANTGMTVTAEGRVVERGRAPVLVEPVKATLRLKRKGRFQVYALDHDGRKRPDAAAVPATQSGQGIEFGIDGAKYRTLYYLVEYQG
jgi:hypothetical protein